MDEELIKKSIAKLEELHKDSKRLIDGLTEVCDNKYVEDAIAYITANEEIEKFIGRTVYVVYLHIYKEPIIEEKIVAQVNLLNSLFLVRSEFCNDWCWYRSCEIGTKVFLTRKDAEEYMEIMSGVKTSSDNGLEIDHLRKLNKGVELKVRFPEDELGMNHKKELV
jgi:hypothetical protein